MKDTGYAFELPFKVRDYECDLEGIVNNANYQHYMEHTRHEFLLAAGISFADMYQAGITPVVARIQIAYKTPLRSRDEFVSKVRGQVDTVCLVHGKLSECPELGEKLQPYYDPQ